MFFTVQFVFKKELLDRSNSLLELRPYGQPGQLPIVVEATLLIALKAQIL